jgi:hypothetical protein
MFNHIMVGSNDIARSKKFYDALFAAVGGKPGNEDAKGRLIYVHDGGVLMVSKPIDGGKATHSNGGTRHGRFQDGRPGAGQGLARRRSRERWHLDRGPAWHSSRRRDVPRLPARS